jgi:hypothetical protein
VAVGSGAMSTSVSPTRNYRPLATRGTRHLGTSSNQPGLDAADLSWAHTLFYDVHIPLNEPDLLTKVSPRTALGCHLGYDHTRRGHFVYVPSLRRISTYHVASWCGESSFTVAKSIGADTPVTYHTMHDLACGDATRGLLPRNRNAHAASGLGCAEEGEVSRTCGKEGEPTRYETNALDAVRNAFEEQGTSPTWARPRAARCRALRRTNVRRKPAHHHRRTRKSKYWGIVKD